MLGTMAKKKPTDRHSQPRYAFHLEQALLDALGRYCEAQKLVPDKSEVVRLALREYLEREGFWPPSPQKEGE